MNNPKNSNPYSFQDDAIKAIVKDYQKNPFNKNLLVLPTGGGKTLAAIRAIDELIKQKLLSEKDRVLWVVHSITLRDQTEKVLNNPKWKKKFEFSDKLPKILIIKMKTAGEKIIKNDVNRRVKIIIIDEAHHSAAASYKKFFKDKLGIFGLTATPTRNDDSKLQFDKIIYSITTRELIRRNVIIEPRIHSIPTGIQIDINSLSDKSGLDRFNTEARNQFIAKTIFNSKQLYKKAIIYVWTVKHTISLCEVLQKNNKFMGNYYDHIGFIHGSGNADGHMSNEDYLDKNKSYDKSIIVNCGVLTEGFDDPSIDTIVMAVPTNSLIYYIQCVGRAMRTPDVAKNSYAYIVEFEDNMPNIRYRINNKWLFADISDVLEPIVIEKECYSVDNFHEIYQGILDQHVIKKSFAESIASREDIETKNVLLYNPTESLKDTAWSFIPINNDNRDKYLRLFNTLSINIDRYHDVSPKWIFSEKFGVYEEFEHLKKMPEKVDFLRALELSKKEIDKNKRVERLKYYTFKLIEEYPEGFLDFLSDCVNKEDIITQFEYAKELNTHVVKFPLFLSDLYEAIYADEKIVKFFNDFLNILNDIKNSSKPIKQHLLIENEINNLDTIPIPIRCLHSIKLIVRENLKNIMFSLKEEKIG